jgi:hypothetical protein
MCVDLYWQVSLSSYHMAYLSWDHRHAQAVYGPQPHGPGQAGRRGGSEAARARASHTGVARPPSKE